MSFDLHSGHVASEMVPLPINIPHILFDYADGRFTINDSRILLGNSDFSLRGDVTNIDSFLSETGLLKAELDFISSYTDVTELMDLVSGLGTTDSTAVPEPEEEISDSAVALALRPPARPERPAPPAPEPPRPASAPAPAPQAPAAPAAAAAPAPVAPSRGEIQSWQSRVQRNIARHMQRARLPAGRGQVQANLSISVAVNGAASARLIASTGNPDVDAALQRQAASLPALPPPPGGQGVPLNLPVVVAYR